MSDTVQWFLESEICSMPKPECVVIIPIYKKNLSSNEIYAVKRAINNLKEYDICFICPSHMDCSFYCREFNMIKIKEFRQWHNSVSSYNRLLLNKKFYCTFKEYKYMLICQTDALIISDSKKLKAFCDKDYDYIGAPWLKCCDKGGKEIPKYHIRKWSKFGWLYKLCKVRCCMVGNGGLSLRKIDALLMLLKKQWFQALVWDDNEDLFFSYYGNINIKCNKNDKTKIDFRVAPASVAKSFSLEECMDRNKIIENNPFGVHAWEKYFPELIHILN